MKEHFENMKKALEAYERVRRFINDFRKHKKALSDKDILSEEGLT